MPIFDEVWDQNEYLHRQMVNLKSIPANHLMKLKTLKFDFVEYKTNHLIACHLYERMTILCHNQYGMFTDFHQRRECMDASTFFEMCLKNHAAYGIQKKYWPELFAVNPYSRPIPHFEELHFGKKN